MARYGSLDFAKKLHFKSVVKIINKAFEEREKETLYQMYLSILPNFDKKSYLTFEQFYKKYGNKNKLKIKMDKRSTDEIMEELIAIEKQFRKE